MKNFTHQHVKKRRSIVKDLFFKRRSETITKILTTFILICTCSIAHAQNLIKGQVIDATTKEGLIGASVIIKTSNEGIATDLDGNFELKTEQKFPFILLVSFVGYETKEVSITEKNAGNLTIALLDGQQLTETVIVGYQTQERKSVVGSVSKVNNEALQSLPAAGLDAKLQGVAAGVQINNPSGTPGNQVSVRVRGATSINATNEPLYVIDGVFINNKSLSSLDLGGKSTSPLADINPADIESVQVLKDASATAIYGSRGANGVIIITTKRGDYNQKPTISFSSNTGVALTPKNKFWDLVTGQQHAEIVNEMWVNSGQDNPSLNRTFENRPFRPKSEGGRGLPEEQQTYDRLSKIFRTAVIQSYDLSLEGGTASTKYYLGGSYTHQQGIIKLADFKRGSFKFNLDQKVNKVLSLGTSNSLSYSYRDQVREGTGPQAGIFQAALGTPTYLPEYDENGTPLRWAGFDNVDVLLENYNVHTGSLRYIGNIYADLKIVPGLNLRSTFSADYNNYREKEYWNDKTLVGLAPTNGRATDASTDNFTWINEQLLTYKLKVNDIHHINLLAGNTIQSNTTTRMVITGSNFPNNSFTQISSAANRTANQSWTGNHLVSFFARGDYNYAHRYFLEASFRADASSKFGKNNKWGYFPSVGLAWRVKEEKFLREVDAVSELKVRGSFGITGNQGGIDDFAYAGLWSGSAGYPDAAGGTEMPGTAPLQLANPDLKWERTRQVDLGLDVSFLNNRLNFSIDLYNKYTSDLLLAIQTPSITGYNSYFANAGEVSNKGIDFTINTVNFDKKNFKWTTAINFSANKNKVEKLETPITFGTRTLLRHEEGHSLYSFYMYKQLYVDAQTGDAVYEDIDGDGKITAEDRQILGNALPKFYGGIQNKFTFGRFDVNLNLTYQYGNKKVSFDRILGERGGTADANRFMNTVMLDRWQKPGDITDVPRVTSVGNNYGIEQTSRLLEDASFLRIQSLNLGYTIPSHLLQKIKISSLRLYAQATNLWVFTPYMGPDPESTYSYSEQGIDVGTSPQPRTVTFGLNVTF